MLDYRVKITVTRTHYVTLSAHNEDYLDDEVVDAVERLGYDHTVEFSHEIEEVFLGED